MSHIYTSILMMVFMEYNIKHMYKFNVTYHLFSVFSLDHTKQHFCSPLETVLYVSICDNVKVACYSCNIYACHITNSNASVLLVTPSMYKHLAAHNIFSTYSSIFLYIIIYIHYHNHNYVVFSPFNPYSHILFAIPLSF